MKKNTCSFCEIIRRKVLEKGVTPHHLSHDSLAILAERLAMSHIYFLHNAFGLMKAGALMSYRI